jgi:hypothetical protein
MIENRNLQPGTRLVARYHKQSYSCEVVGGEGGKLRYRFQDGREFKSPSAAGMAITGKACNGWAFWSVEVVESVPTPALQQTEAQKADSGETAEVAEVQETMEAGAGEQKETPLEVSATLSEGLSPARKPLFRTPNQKGTPEGQTRWYCHDCAKSFLVTTGQMPESCPAGHKA